MKIWAFVLISLIFSMALYAEDESFYKAHSLTYSRSTVLVKNGIVSYGGNGFYGIAKELGRANAKAITHCVGYNVEEVSKKYFIHANLYFGAGKSKDSSNLGANSNQPMALKFSFGPSFGKFGIQAGLYCKLINQGLSYSRKYAMGYFFGTPGVYGVHYFDKLKSLEGGFLVSTVYQINESTGIRATYGFGKIKNKQRRVDGSGSEIEVKFYKTFEETNNLGFFVSYRYLKYKVKGIDEFVDSRGNNGTSRFPASQWIQNSLQIGLNLPIKFKG